MRPGLRIGLLIAAGLAGIAGTLYWRSERPSPNQPIGAGPAGPPVPREPWGKPWRTGPVLVVGLGDSVTAGFGTTPEHSYFSRVVSNPPDELPDMTGLCLRSVFPNLKTLNLSVSGTISAEHVEEQLPRLAKAGPETLGIVLMTTGGNDLIHNYGRSPPREGAMYGARLEEAKPWIASFEKRLDGMIRSIRDRFPGGCHLFIADIFDPTDGEGDIEHAGLPAWPEGEAVLGAYNEVIHRTAGKFDFVHVVGMHDAFLGHGIHCRRSGGKHYRSEDPYYWYYSNLEDPNDRGYDAIRRLFLLKIAEVFSKSG